MGHLNIIRMTRASRGFYARIGPYLSRREIVSELGGPIWDDDGKTWFVATRGKTMLGFAAMREVGGKMRFSSAYVLPKHRRKGVYTALIRARVEDVKVGMTITTTATKASSPALRKAGFRATGERGSFTTMELSR